MLWVLLYYGNRVLGYYGIGGNMAIVHYGIIALGCLGITVRWYSGITVIVH